MNQTESQSKQAGEPASNTGSPRNRRLPLVIVIVAVLASAIMHGLLDGRWSVATDLIQQGKRLEQLPQRCGNWILLTESELDESAARLLRCYGSAVRVYQNEITQATVTVAVLFGPRGPIAVHTPEICYSSIGTEQLGERTKETLKTANGDQSLWSVQFADESSTEPTLSVWYAWSDGGPWVATDNPRYWMTENLYKIQVASPINPVTDDQCEDFLKQLLPQLDPLLGHT
ncbi:exosortase-associated EpsI family protein [Novipirellula artificiosorum]|uniref:Methanolan biosynthesis EpsI domain-containing protein n=1 Tax=Novipirellula artificiosorum TaxID=2528016 RepID=A0A5C6D059_9BACT|nr:exosortase-associated EpsI family protein [Novipirellula artificiosorum]TWU29131.1 hypothetical protein Poly41_67030 [Novipirellula artificiosorum]